MAVEGDQAQAIGLSRGGQTTKIHAVCDLLCRLVTLALTADHVSDIRAAELMTPEATRFRLLVAQKGYDADRFRKALREARATPDIPGRFNPKRRIRHDARRHRDCCSSKPSSAA